MHTFALYLYFLVFFVQVTSTLLILCENGFALQVPAPLPGEQDTVSTYQIKTLPTQYFHFYSIKSRMKVKSPVEEFNVLHVPEISVPILHHRIFAKLPEGEGQVESICG